MSDTNNKPRAAEADTASVAVPEGFKLVPNLGDLVERLALKHIAPNAKAMFPDKDYRETEQFRRVLAYTEDMLAALAQDAAVGRKVFLPMRRLARLARNGLRV